MTVTTYVQILFMTTYVYNRLCFCDNFIFVIIHKILMVTFILCVATYILYMWQLRFLKLFIFVATYV